MHKVQPKQRVRIISVDLAFSADADDGKVADEISALLSENGSANPDSTILDWMYQPGSERMVTSSSNPVESEVFFIGEQS